MAEDVYRLIPKEFSSFLRITDPIGVTFAGYKGSDNIQIDFTNMTPLFGVSQSMGQSTTQVMSQKAASDELTKKADLTRTFDNYKVVYTADGTIPIVDLSGKVDKKVICNVTQVTGVTYTDKTTARNAVTANLRGIGQIITYKLTTGWITEQYIGADVSGWATENNWKSLGTDGGIFDASAATNNYSMTLAQAIEAVPTGSRKNGLLLKYAHLKKGSGATSQLTVLSTVSGGVSASTGGAISDGNLQTRTVNVRGLKSVELQVMISGVGVGLAFFDNSGVFVGGYNVASGSVERKVISVPASAESLKIPYYTDAYASSTSRPLFDNNIIGTYPKNSGWLTVQFTGLDTTAWSDVDNWKPFTNTPIFDVSNASGNFNLTLSTALTLVPESHYQRGLMIRFNTINKTSDGKVFSEWTSPSSYVKKNQVYNATGTVSSNTSYDVLFGLPVTEGIVYKFRANNTLATSFYTLISFWTAIGAQRRIVTSPTVNNGSEIVIDVLSGETLLGMYLRAPTASVPNLNITDSIEYCYSTDITEVNEYLTYEYTGTSTLKADFTNVNNWKLAGSNNSSSGVQYASQNNFLPTNTAEQNAIAMQAMLDKAGTIIIDSAGTYPLCNTMKIKDNTTLRFEADTKILKSTNSAGKSAAYVFINEGAFTRTTNENIKIQGLHLICNNLEMGDDIERIPGLRGHIALFHVRNVELSNITCLDLLSVSFLVHGCAYNNALFERFNVVGRKDGIHLSWGKNFIIRDCIFKTYDDPIALNAHDYVNGGAPELGWIENGIIENCYDLADDTTTGFFCRILGGSWVDWYSGMSVQQGDTVVNGGRMYRVNMTPSLATFTSTTAPTHTGGNAVLDGITWLMIQDKNIVYNAGCRNIHFRNIYLQKNRPFGLAIYFDRDMYSRSFYPNSIAPIQENIILENIVCEATITTLVWVITPIDALKIINSTILDSTTIVRLENIGATGLIYDTSHVLMQGNTFKKAGSQIVVSSPSRLTKARVLGSLALKEDFSGTFDGTVTVLEKDI